MFKSIFKKRILVPPHEENWHTYFSRINNQIASIIVDINIANIAPVKNLSEVFYLIIPFDYSNEEGLPTPESYKLINEVEDKISELNVRYGENLIHVATLTMNSERLQMYYCHKVENTHSFIEQVEKEFGERLTYQLDHRNDPKWDDFYHLAYPLPFQLEMIKNRTVLRQLTQAGDDLLDSRKVNHYLFFKTEQGLDQFLQFALKEKFVLFLMEKQNAQWRLGICRQDYVSYEQIDELCLPLWEKAQVYNGIYTGWESEVIRKEN